MSWIKTIKYQEAKSRLKKIYDKVKGPDDNIDDIIGLSPNDSDDPTNWSHN